MRAYLGHKELLVFVWHFLWCMNIELRKKTKRKKGRVNNSPLYARITSSATNATRGTHMHELHLKGFLRIVCDTVS
jgi:hypothetical protein